MSGGRYVVDTNIAFYLLGGNETVIQLLSDKGLHLSVKTRMELLSFPGMVRSELPRIHAFLDAWPVEDLHTRIEEEDIRLRSAYRLKLPDSIIAATASHVGIPLVTADKAMLRLGDEIEVLRFEPKG
ncbi:MAG: type II toxin-antitoxin system VapC family toxin [Bacteroidetes bacterium]|nr:type II toxin-antitoxin system VapC family toxin [Bacteroidota bacterium]